MPLVPPNIESLQPYIPGMSADEVKRKFNLPTIVKLASNENPIGPSPLALRAIGPDLAAAHIYPNGGYDLRVELAARYRLKLENVIAGNGSEGIMSVIIRTFLCDDDEVLTTEAAFIGFQVLARSRGVVYRTVPYRDWHYDLEAIAAAITSRTKIIYLANPNNPTGTMFTREEFDAFYGKVPERVLIILDEAYWEYAAANPAFPDSMTYRYDNVITLRTFSKAYGLAGLRVGYGFAHGELIQNLLKVKLPFEPGSIAQSAAVGAIADTEHLRKSVEMNEAGRRRLLEYFANAGVKAVPSQANFVMICPGSETEVNRLHHGLLSRGIIVRPLRGFGLPECMRVTIGTPEEMTAFMTAFDALNALK